jgi:hypothetical protein
MPRSLVLLSSVILVWVLSEDDYSYWYWFVLMKGSWMMAIFPVASCFLRSAISAVERLGWVWWWWWGLGELRWGWWWGVELGWWWWLLVKDRWCSWWYGMEWWGFLSTARFTDIPLHHQTIHRVYFIIQKSMCISNCFTSLSYMLHTSFGTKQTLLQGTNIIHGFYKITHRRGVWLGRQACHGGGDANLVMPRSMTEGGVEL